MVVFAPLVQNSGPFLCQLFPICTEVPSKPVAAPSSSIANQSESRSEWQVLVYSCTRVLVGHFSRVDTGGSDEAEAQRFRRSLVTSSRYTYAMPVMDLSSSAERKK